MTADLIDKVLDGYTLRTFMIPDPAIPSNHPEHLEGVELTHMVITENLMWAKSEATHLNHSFGSSSGSLCAWCYSSPADIFASYAPATCKLFLMFKSRYKKHVLVTKKQLHVDFGFGIEYLDGGHKREDRGGCQTQDRNVRLRRYL